MLMQRPCMMEAVTASQRLVFPCLYEIDISLTGSRGRTWGVLVATRGLTLMLAMPIYPYPACVIWEVTLARLQSDFGVTKAN